MSSDSKTIKFWDDVAKKTGGVYNADVFKDDKKLHYSDLETNIPYIRAAQKALELRWGGLDNEFKDKTAEQIAADPKLRHLIVTEARDYISWFNNNIGRTAEIGAKVKLGSSQQQLAFLYLMDVHDHASMDMSSVGHFLWQGVATDPTMLASIGAGFFSFGTGTAAGVTLREGAVLAGKEGIKDLIKYGAKWAVEKGVETGITKGMKYGAMQGFGTGLATNIVRSGEMDIDGAKIQRQKFASWETLEDVTMSTGGGAVMGGGMAGVGHGIGLGWNKWRGKTPGTTSSTIGMTAGSMPTSSMPTGRVMSAGAFGGSESTTFSKDLWTTAKMAPKNLLYAFYDPQQTNFDSVGRMAAKTMKFIYPKAKELGKDIPLMPSLRRRMNELDKMDLDSYRYIYPVVDKIDDVIDAKLKPIFSTSGHLGDIQEAQAIAKKLGQISEKIKRGDDPALFSTEINDALTKLPNIRTAIEPSLAALKADLAPISADVEKITVPGMRGTSTRLVQVAQTDKSAIKSLKKSRIDAMQEQITLVANQGQNAIDHINKSVTDLTDLNTIAVKDRAVFAEDLNKISLDLDKGLKDVTQIAATLVDGAAMRRTGLRKNPTTGAIEPAPLEELRKLKRSIDQKYVNPEARGLAVMPPKDVHENAENFFILTVEYGKKYAFKDDGKGGKTFIPVGDRQVEYTNKLAEFVAHMYRQGHDQDALRALQYLRYHEASDSYDLVPGKLAEAVTENLRGTFHNKGLNIAEDAHYKYWNQKIDDLVQKRDHSPRPEGPRDVQVWAVEKLKRYVYGRMYPGSIGADFEGKGYLAVPYKHDFQEKFFLKTRQEVFAYLTGRKVVTIADYNAAGRSKTPYVAASQAEKALGTTIMASRFYGFGWDKTPEKAGFLRSNWVSHAILDAPTILKAPVRVIASPLKVGYEATKAIAGVEIPFLGWKPVKTALIATSATAILTGGAHYVGENYFPENKTTNAVTGALYKVSAAPAFWLGDVVTLPLQGSIAVGKTATKPLTKWDNFLGLQPEYARPSFYRDLVSGKKDAKKPDETSTAGGTTADPAAAGASAPAADGKPIDQSKLTSAQLTQLDADRKLAKEQLIALGKSVADLSASVTKDGWNDTKIAQVKTLSDQQQKLHTQIGTLDMGDYAKSIDTDASNTLQSYLIPYSDKSSGRRPPEIASYEQRKIERDAPVIAAVRTWRNDVLNLNNELAANSTAANNGWTADRKARLKTLVDQENAFAKNAYFLDNTERLNHQQGYGWMKELLAAEPSSSKIGPLADTLVFIPQVNAAGVTVGGGSLAGIHNNAAGGGGNLAGSPAAIAAAKAEQERLAKEQAAAAKAQQDAAAAQSAQEQARVQQGQQEAAAAGQSEYTDPVTGKKYRSHVTDDGRTLWETYVDTMAVDGDDNVTQLVNKAGHGLGGAVSSAGDWLKNTFNRLMHKKDGSGRALIRETSAGLLSIIGMAAFVGPMLDKLGIGKIPIVGSLLKLGALVLIFMAARKGIDSFMDKPEAAVGSTAIGNANQGSTGTIPRVPEAEINAASIQQRIEDNKAGIAAPGGPVQTVVRSQSSDGGTPKIFVINDNGDTDPYFDQVSGIMKDGKPALQVRADNGQTYISLGVVGDEVVQSGKIHGNIVVPKDRLGDQEEKLKGMQFEAVSNDKVGSDAFLMYIGGQKHVFNLDQGKNFSQLAPENN